MARAPQIRNNAPMTPNTTNARASRTDGEATRARILQAAGELFGSRGFAETTSKAVAAHAGVDLASINYHFGSRSGLYQATLIEAHRRLFTVDALSQLVHAPLPASERLRILMTQLVSQATSAQTNWHLGLLAAEVMAPSSHLQVLSQTESAPKLSLVRQLVAEIIGINADDPVVTRCMFSVGAPCIMMLIARRELPGPLHELRHMQPEVLVDHLHRFAMAGLAAIRASLTPPADPQP